MFFISKNVEMDKIVKPTLRRTNQRHKMKAVLCIDTGIVYSSSRDAADILIAKNIILSPEDIRKVCRGERKTAAGLRWAFVKFSSN